MPSRAWVVTEISITTYVGSLFRCPHGLELLRDEIIFGRHAQTVSMPSRAWVVTVFMCRFNVKTKFQCPHGLELLPEILSRLTPIHSSFNALTGLSCYIRWIFMEQLNHCFNALTGLSCYYHGFFICLNNRNVSMPSRAWVVTCPMTVLPGKLECFNALTGLSCYG